MRIDIIGAGSLGLLLAGGLIHTGNEVRLWCRSKEQSIELTCNGFTVSQDDGQPPVRIVGETFAAAPMWEFTDKYLQEPGDWIIATVKQNILHNYLPEYLLGIKERNIKIVCFQNGSGHMELLGRLLPEARLYAAVTTEAANRKSSTEIIHAGKGETWIGNWFAGNYNNNEADQTARDAISLARELSLAGFSTHLSKEVGSMIYRKLLINAVINPLTAIWRIPNGDLLVSDDRMQLMKELYDEAVSVYEANGIVHEVNTWDNILEVCRNTSGNISSMLTDVLASRTTEIRWINGSIVDMAERSGMETPLHRWICRLIEGMITEER